MFAPVSCPTGLQADASPKIRRILGEVGGGGFSAQPAHKLPSWKGEVPSTKASDRTARGLETGANEGAAGQDSLRE